MVADDHAIDSLKVWFEIEYRELKKEWQSSKYEKLSDCPSFKLTYTYKEAIDILIKGTDSIADHKSEALKKMIEEELETENHWKQQRK